MHVPLTLNKQTDTNIIINGYHETAIQLYKKNQAGKHINGPIPLSPVYETLKLLGSTFIGRLLTLYMTHLDTLVCLIYVYAYKNS